MSSSTTPETPSPPWGTSIMAALIVICFLSSPRPLFFILSTCSLLSPWSAYYHSPFCSFVLPQTSSRYHSITIDITFYVPSLVSRLCVLHMDDSCLFISAWSDDSSCCSYRTLHKPHPAFTNIPLSGTLCCVENHGLCAYRCLHPEPGVQKTPYIYHIDVTLQWHSQLIVLYGALLFRAVHIHRPR